jgi:transposase
MMIIGVDAHKSVHAAVALDDAGREVAAWRGPNSPAGWAGGGGGGGRPPPPPPPPPPPRGGGGGGGGRGARVAAGAGAPAARAADAERAWGIEGAGNYGRGLAQHLVTAGETVYDINPRWTAKERQHARRPGKSDRLDARAVALVVRREAATLPPLLAEDETAVLDLLVTEREGALAEATRLRNQLHALLL